MLGRRKNKAQKYGKNFIQKFLPNDTAFCRSRFSASDKPTADGTAVVSVQRKKAFGVKII